MKNILEVVKVHTKMTEILKEQTKDLLEWSIKHEENTKTMAKNVSEILNKK